MIPRAAIFGNPSIGKPTISPDGCWLAWSASVSNVMNLWAAPRTDRTQARQLTFDTRRGVTGHMWTKDSAFMLFTQDTDGDENFKLYGVDVGSGAIRCLTPFDGTRAAVLSLRGRSADTILISLNRRDKRYADIYTLQVRTGALSLVMENEGFASFVIDDDQQVRFAVRRTLDGGRQLLERKEQRWTPRITVGAEDARNTGWSHLDDTGSVLYGFDSRGRNTGALVATDVATGEQTVLGMSELADVSSMMSDPVTHRPVAYWTSYERSTVGVIDETIRPDVEYLDGSAIGQWGVVSQTLDRRFWLIGASSDTQAGITWLYDRSAKSLERVFVHRPELSELSLARMRSTVVTARDGLPLVCYLTVPRHADSGGSLQVKSPVPMVLFVHGGPWDRDRFGFNGTHQWLADRGYAVLNVNFRSSTGFGKHFINAGNGEWGRKMDDDLDDAVDWAIKAGIADPARIAIVGGSYGGFAVLSALTKRPGRYACGVDIVGPSNLASLLKAIPPHWEHERETLHRAVGDPTTAEGLIELRSRSPLYAAKAIADPLLIAQGANDPRVPQRESEQMVEELVSRGIPVTYLLFPDEGHGFVREPNRLVFNAMMEAFLARHLGGSCEPFAPDDFLGNSMQIRQGDLLTLHA